MVAIVFDIGTAYIGYRQLLAQTQAAALAGGAVMSNDNETVGQVQTTATEYSGSTGDANLNSSLLTNVQVTATHEVPVERRRHQRGSTLLHRVQPMRLFFDRVNALQVTETAQCTDDIRQSVWLGLNHWNLSATAIGERKGRIQWSVERGNCR